MNAAYANNKDLYATIAASIYHNDYWDNMEFKQDGSPNPDGEKRRSICKNILLGLMYGRGANSIAEKLSISKEEAQQVIDSFYKAFPKVKKWMDETDKFAKEKGYVEDLWGRRRRLPDIQLPKFSIIDNNKNTSFNPLLGSKGLNTQTSKIPYYADKCKKASSFKQIRSVIEEAKKDNITIKDNSSLISQAQRQSVNARIQGRFIALPL